MKQLDTLKPFIKQHRIWVGVGFAVVVFIFVLMIARGVSGKDMSLLYANLDNHASADIIAALDAQGTAYEVRGNAIFVPTTERDVLRIQLAGQGLPNNSVQGYEILDSLTGFGTTSQMFDAAYWRAKEGELSRTLIASQNIRAARVHISAANTRPFAAQPTTTASVTITTDGATPNSAQVLAIRHLIASAIPNLSPDNVAVIDSTKGLLSADDRNATTDQSETLRTRVLRMLEAHVGYGNAVVEIAVDTVSQTEQIIERVIDPNSRTAISSDTQETSSNSQDTTGGQVTVASNLPTGDASQNGSSSGETLETRTVTNYEISETQREITRAAGAVKRISVAVLINQPADAEPRSDTELETLRSLVASAVGFDATRGDEITLHAMVFDTPPQNGTLAVESMTTPLDLRKLIQTGVLAVVTIILGLFVVRPLLISRPTPPILPEPTLIDIGPDLTDDAPPTEDPSDRLKRLISERQRDSMKILQNWVEPTQNRGAQ